MPRNTATPATRRGEVEAAVRRDLHVIGDPILATGALAMTAIALARSIDAPGTSPTARSMCARALSDILATLSDQAPDAPAADDPIDVLATRRAQRKAATS